MAVGNKPLLTFARTLDDGQDTALAEVRQRL
jgi:hypothetical protein